MPCGPTILTLEVTITPEGLFALLMLVILVSGAMLAVNVLERKRRG